MPHLKKRAKKFYATSFKRRVLLGGGGVGWFLLGFFWHVAGAETVSQTPGELDPDSPFSRMGT